MRFTLLFLTCFSFCACNDDNADPNNVLTIQGMVVDTEENPIEGVLVTALINNSITALTNVAGDFVIEVEVGTELIFTKTGFITDTLATTSEMIVVLQKTPANEFADAFLAGSNAVLNPVFSPGTIQATTDLGALAEYPVGFMTADFKGAVSPNSPPWFADWSFYSRIVSGELVSAPLNLQPIEVWNETTMANAGTEINWTNNKTYVLEGAVYVAEGQSLNIEPGTIIQGKPGQAANASLLIITRGAKINAIGTAENPIIFTYEGDTGGSSANLRQQWGGLIILGNSTLNTLPSEQMVEGLSGALMDARNSYGGNDEADNSGVLQYLSIRHGGPILNAAEPMSSLTLAGVGSGTTIENVEVVSSAGDGWMIFGGTVNTKQVISAYNLDDGFDFDQGARGNHQFVVVHQAPTLGSADRSGEHDGGTNPETGTPFSIPTIFNLTSIGNSDSRLMTFRDNAGGIYRNCIFADYAKGVDIEFLGDNEQDTYQMWQAGNLDFSNNIFWNIGAGSEPADIFVVKE